MTILCTKVILKVSKLMVPFLRASHIYVAIIIFVSHCLAIKGLIGKLPATARG